MGHIEKRPAVINDKVEAQLGAYLTLGFDHRLLDGAIADQFLSHVKRSLENWTE
ncbi:Dihydrolipoyllysine-residue acetyltransferase component of pyruvate dehydrogenase complex [compost metagenome]